MWHRKDITLITPISPISPISPSLPRKKNRLSGKPNSPLNLYSAFYSDARHSLTFFSMRAATSSASAFTNFSPTIFS